MTITQTVEIPVDRRLFISLPVELPPGKAKVTITSQVDISPVNDYKAVTNLRGLAKKMGSTLSMESFQEMQQEDLCLEEEKHQIFFQ